MRARTSIRTSVTRMTVDLQRQMHAKRTAADYYRMHEREQQFQYDVTGSIGFAPVEDTIKILFDTMFLYEYGNRRDSQLLEPFVKFGFSQVVGPAGTIPYAHVVDWKQDSDLNYIGATVVVGAHNPSIALTGASSHESLTFKATLHASFQGYGVPLDPATPDDDGTNTSAPPPAPAPTAASPVQSAADVDSASSAPYPPNLDSLQYPDYPSGPLGGTSDWEEMASWSGGSLDDWGVPAEEGTLKVNGSGVLTTDNPDEVKLYVEPASVKGGDKYAAMWLAGGAVGTGYKARMEFLLNTSGQLDLSGCNAVVVNMQDRQRGLAFFFGALGIGWVTDLRLLGTNQGDKVITNQAGHLEDDGPSGVFGQNKGGLVSYTDRITTAGNGVFSIPQTAVNAVYRYASTYPNGLSHAYVELWRDGSTVYAALYNGNPDTSTPVYMSSYSVANRPAYSPNAIGYFGWTMSYMPPANGSEPGYQPRGVVSATLYKRA